MGSRGELEWGLEWDSNGESTFDRGMLYGVLSCWGRPLCRCSITQPILVPIWGRRYVAYCPWLPPTARSPGYEGVACVQPWEEGVFSRLAAWSSEVGIRGSYFSVLRSPYVWARQEVGEATHNSHSASWSSR